MGCGSSSPTVSEDTGYYDNTRRHDDNTGGNGGHDDGHRDTTITEPDHDDRVDHGDNNHDHHDNRHDHHHDHHDNRHDHHHDHHDNRHDHHHDHHDNRHDHDHDNRHHDDRGDRDRGGRDKPDKDDGLGLKYITKDFRVHPTPTYSDSEPPSRGQFTDEEFPLHVAIEEYGRYNLEWKRPSELVDDPVLFSEGTTRFDIGQGSAGTCWFLSMVANLSENPKLLHRVLKPNDYNPRTGVFHCRFWKFGVWEDVYTDDHLPVIYGRQIWGARSATDDKEMWVSLLEKAFGKLHGSYNSIYGGQSSDAYLALTGGIAERIDFEEDNVNPMRIFHRIRNALYTGAMVCCTVPDEFDGQHGLIGGHAYSLTGAEEANRFDGQTEQLLRVRNPWGNTEWKGRWSDESSDWQSIPENSIPRVNIDDGEFWISLRDFMKYFSQTTICSITPDFDMDGCSDSLNNVLKIYGQWQGPTAAGFKERLSNPGFVFTVPDEGMSEDGTVPLVVQLIQKTEHRKTDKFSIRCDLYKVLGMQQGRRHKYVLELLGTETNVFSPAIQCAFRHRVEPGHYVVVPSTLDPGQEKEFLIRVFAPCKLYDCNEIPERSTLMSCDSQSEWNGTKLDTCETIFGRWSGRNSGGQISKRETHANNPQFAFTVPDRGGPLPVIFHLLQPQGGQQYPIGIRVYPLRSHAPVDIDYLYDNYDNCPEPVEGGTFVITWDLDVKYMLPPGNYLALVHMDEEGTQQDFVLHMRSCAHLNVRGFQTGA